MTEQEKKAMLIRAILLVKDLIEDMFMDEQRNFKDKWMHDFYFMLNDKVLELMNEKGVWE